MVDKTLVEQAAELIAEAQMLTNAAGIQSENEKKFSIAKQAASRAIAEDKISALEENVTEPNQQSITDAQKAYRDNPDRDTLDAYWQALNDDAAQESASVTEKASQHLETIKAVYDADKSEANLAAYWLAVEKAADAGVK